MLCVWNMPRGLKWINLCFHISIKKQILASLGTQTWRSYSWKLLSTILVARQQILPQQRSVQFVAAYHKFLWINVIRSFLWKVKYMFISPPGWFVFHESHPVQFCLLCSLCNNFKELIFSILFRFRIVSRDMSSVKATPLFLKPRAYINT